MAQIKRPPKPKWRDVAPGMRIKFRFGPTEALNAARRGARLSGLREGAVDPEFAFVAGAVVWGAVEWEGFGDPDWEGDDVADCPPAPLTPENIVLVLQSMPDVFDDVAGFYVDPLMELLAEKNGSGPSPNGISEAGLASATDAVKPAPSAPTD